MQCDMCGSEERLFKTNIEGTILNVCRACSKFGKVISEIKEPEKIKPKKIIITKSEPETEIIEIVVNDFAEKIRSRREKLGLKQEDFAKRISEKESVIHKLEIGEFKPSLELARKLEKTLNIKLIEEYEEEHKTSTKTDTEIPTIGDLIKIRKRK
ncbi:multiprotein bridging factor aMBF1 [Candidatus Woesearchaeota archaeon]|nr:multiprotein bridging factor aMBF1 [Candidatus Woesearchaeota archaeon]